MVNKNIIGLLGKKHVGKDTVAEYMTNKYGVMTYALAEPLKEMVGMLFNLDYEQMHGELKEVVDERWGCTPRHMFQTIGTEICRKQLHNYIPNVKENEFWLMKFEQWLSDNEYMYICVTDLRVKNEIDFIKKLGGKIIYIERETKEKDVHSSEMYEVQESDYDFHIINNGTLDELYEKVDEIMEK